MALAFQVIPRSGDERQAPGRRIVTRHPKPGAGHERPKGVDLFATLAPVEAPCPDDASTGMAKRLQRFDDIGSFGVFEHAAPRHDIRRCDGAVDFGVGGVAANEFYLSGQLERIASLSAIKSASSSTNRA